MSKVLVHLQNKWFYYLFCVIWASIIYYFSSQENLPSPAVSLIDFLFKKCAHMFFYAVFYFSLFCAVYLSNQGKISKKTFIIPLLICFLYACSDEYHQSLVANRTASYRDVGYDMLGASIVLLYQQNYL